MPLIDRIRRAARSLTVRLTGAYALALVIVIALMAAAMAWALNLSAGGAALEIADSATREITQLMQSRENASIWQSTDALDALIQWKIADIRRRYDADVWLVDARGFVFALNASSTDTGIFEDESNRAQLTKLLSGAEISGDNLFPQLGHNVISIGIPWRNRSGDVSGAVVMHITANVTYVSLPIMRGAFVIIAIALLACFALFMLTRRMTQPLNDVILAASDYARGDFERRVSRIGEDEMGQLGATVNAMAEELSRLEAARRDFVSNVSHELRSPMTSIAGYVEGMLDQTIPEDQHKKYLSVVKDETSRLNKLIADLLDISRIESGAFPINLSNFDINELIRRALIQYEKRITDAGIEVEAVFRQDPCMVHADQDRISQVVINLIDNAVKFMGGSTDAARLLRVWTHESERACHISIEDTGPGIPGGDMAHIFDRFYTADKARTSGRGIGLGLFIVKRILVQHDRDIRVSSVPGKGATFTFELPLAADK